MSTEPLDSRTVEVCIGVLVEMQTEHIQAGRTEAAGWLRDAAQRLRDRYRGSLPAPSPTYPGTWRTPQQKPDDESIVDEFSEMLREKVAAVSEAEDQIDELRKNLQHEHDRIDGVVTSQAQLQKWGSELTDRVKQIEENIGLIDLRMAFSSHGASVRHLRKRVLKLEQAQRVAEPAKGRGKPKQERRRAASTGTKKGQKR